MAKRDMRREDLIVPYQERSEKSGEDFSSAISASMPMVAIFTRNKLIGWTSVLFAVQNWLAEPAKKDDSMPGIFSIATSILALGAVYLPLFLPPPQKAGVQPQPDGTGAPMPVPP
ncbi:hypothetical protein K470DRAFT_214809 [Piedraia hortae CBS 480.64]|uniref:Uncharacterized protein n=1 Tax=Piedraia hortae CBS 480.64 TaxID=1314780 RepID=A0A6A7C1Y4_9PEZI|nr:hypothetical protein K470DRAFT_214809 [Piedraia hortae CBS 480.64]